MSRNLHALRLSLRSRNRLGLVELICQQPSQRTICATQNGVRSFIITFDVHVILKNFRNMIMKDLTPSVVRVIVVADRKLTH